MIPTRRCKSRIEVAAAEEVAAERATVEEISRNEGKPEAALPKIIEGRLNGWYKERVLVEQEAARAGAGRLGEHPVGGIPHHRRPS